MLLLVLLALFQSPTTSFAVVLLDNLPGTTTYGDLAMSRGDDNSSNQLSLPFAVNFYGNTYNSFFVNNNGNVSFNTRIGNYTPAPFPISGQPMIAPYWADVDTRGGNVDLTGLGNNVYISAPNSNTVVVTWNNVGYYNSHTNQLNNFQLVLENRADTGVGNFDIQFRYEQLQWTTGEVSNGVHAQAGFDAGNNTNFFTLPGSQTASVVDLVNTSNVSAAEPGLWSFAVRNGGLPGSTRDNPLMPVTVNGSFQFEFGIQLNQQMFIDPIVAIGYDYQVSSGPNFASVLLPTGLGDNLFDLYLWNGTSWVLNISNLQGGELHTFGSGVSQFRILGIEDSAGVSPTDPRAFVTGLTFDGAGHVIMSMTPVLSPVPVPAAALLLGSGLAGLAGLLR